MQIGTVLQYGESIYLVKNVDNEGGVKAQLCASEGGYCYPVPGVTLYLSQEGLDACAVLGIAEGI